MLNNSFCEIETLPATSLETNPLPHVKPLRDALLTTLVNFDFEYEQELERIRLGSSAQAVKDRVICRLQKRHRLRREPYLKQLAYLQGRNSAQL